MTQTNPHNRRYWGSRSLLYWYNARDTRVERITKIAPVDSLLFALFLPQLHARNERPIKRCLNYLQRLVSFSLLLRVLQRTPKPAMWMSAAITPDVQSRPWHIYVAHLICCFSHKLFGRLLPYCWNCNDPKYFVGFVFHSTGFANPL